MAKKRQTVEDLRRREALIRAKIDLEKAKKELEKEKRYRR